MPEHASNIVVQHVDGFMIKVTVRGELEKYINGLSSYLLRWRPEGVVNVEYEGSSGTILIETEQHSTPGAWQQQRIRIRNRCRDWVHNVTGYITNTGGPDGHFVDLVEDTESISTGT